MNQDFEQFSELSLPTPLLRALDKMGFKTATPIQAAAIPKALLGKDILGSAQTGTGKTAAFLVPLCARLYPEPGKKALILTPTRELASQISKVLRQLSRDLDLNMALIVGGESFARQKRELAEADVLIATPGRLWDHLNQGLDLSAISILVIDEADRMLDMGFLPQLNQILPHLPKRRQTLFFSATLPPDVIHLSERYLKAPERVRVGAALAPAQTISQEVLQTTQEEKAERLLLEVERREGRILVFTKSQGRTESLSRWLEKHGHKSEILHAGRSQGRRKEALKRFRKGEVRILIATDLAARGLDIEAIEHVINFDMPSSREAFIHRVGRTGRIGHVGKALTFVTARDRGVDEIVHGRTVPGAGKRPSPRSDKPTSNPFSPKSRSRR